MFSEDPSFLFTPNRYFDKWIKSANEAKSPGKDPYGHSQILRQHQMTLWECIEKEKEKMQRYGVIYWSGQAWRHKEKIGINTTHFLSRAERAQRKPGVVTRIAVGTAAA